MKCRIILPLFLVQNNIYCVCRLQWNIMEWKQHHFEAIKLLSAIAIVSAFIRCIKESRFIVVHARMPQNKWTDLLFSEKKEIGGIHSAGLNYGASSLSFVVFAFFCSNNICSCFTKYTLLKPSRFLFSFSITFFTVDLSAAEQLCFIGSYYCYFLLVRLLFWSYILE